jgi:hypothetical protein
MNRREAIAALVALPGVAKISTAPVKPDDVIVVECDLHMSCDMVERIKTTMADVWPGRKVVVFDKGMRMKIVEGTSTT